MKAKEKAICEKAVQLWGQAIEQGFSETTSGYGITIPVFKGAHYAIGALKGFWTPSEQGFAVINKAIEDLERLLDGEAIDGDEDEVHEDKSIQASTPVVKPVVPVVPAPEEAPDPRVKWRITRTDDGEDGYIYTTEGVNGYSVRKYYEETQPEILIDFDGERVLPGEIPLAATFEDDNISDAIFHWIDRKYSFELIREDSRPFDLLVEYLEDNYEILVYNYINGSPEYWTHYLLQYNDVLDSFNEILENGDNFRVVFLEQHD